MADNLDTLIIAASKRFAGNVLMLLKFIKLITQLCKIIVAKTVPGLIYNGSKDVYCPQSVP